MILTNFLGAGIYFLWIKRPSGKSDFGDWHYVVYDVQSSLDLRDEYKFQLRKAYAIPFSRL